MKSTTSLLDDVDQAFSNLSKPSIMYTIPTNKILNRGEYQAVQHDFSGISRDEMTDEQYSMMLIDGALISDQALCYFLPKLAKTVFQERRNEDFLYNRLEKLDKNLLNQEQIQVVDRLITSLKKLEQEIELEEEVEVNAAQMDWEQELLQSESLENRLLLAIAQGDIANVETLIDQGANVNAKDKYSNSSLDIARYGRHTKIIELLQRAGAR